MLENCCKSLYNMYIALQECWFVDGFFFTDFALHNINSFKLMFLEFSKCTGKKAKYQNISMKNLKIKMYIVMI